MGARRVAIAAALGAVGVPEREHTLVGDPPAGRRAVVADDVGVVERQVACVVHATAVVLAHPAL